MPSLLSKRKTTLTMMVSRWFSVRLWGLEKNPIRRLKPPSVQETSEMPLWWFNLPDQTYSFLLKYPRWWTSLVKSWPERVALEHTLLFRRPVESDSLWLHGLQHARPPYPSLSPGVCPSSCPLNWCCYPTISSSATLFCFAFDLSQHWGLFQAVSYLHQVAKILSLQL